VSISLSSNSVKLLRNKKSYIKNVTKKLHSMMYGNVNPISFIVILLGSLSSISVLASANLSSDTISKVVEPIFEPNKALAIQRVEQYDAEIEKLEENSVDGAFKTDIELLENEKKRYQEVNGLPMLSILGGPAYTPEQGLLVAIGGLYSFKTDRTQQQLQRSSVSAFFVSNYVNDDIAYGLQAKHDLYWNNNDLSSSGEFSIGIGQSKHYWGTGYTAAQNTEMGDDTLYSADSMEYTGDLFKRVHDEWYVGALLNARYFDVIDAPLTGEYDEEYQKHKDADFIFGIGIAVKYDTRDVAVNARSGSLFNTELYSYSESIGSDLSYQKLKVDYRTYYDFDEGNVIAFLANYQQAYGDVPYFDMPEIGGPFSMRGLYQGRYRDKLAIEATTEYRYTFRNSSNLLSPHGMTVWAGIGSVAQDFNQLTDAPVYSYGVGYRYELQPRMNLRLDLGMSQHGMGFYFNFTEAF
ncbi:BamA/TamA family outer membrane protein, partial [Vibrio paucivorans]